MKMNMFYLHALTALHVGTGQGVGFIDLPIAREKSTGLPVVPGSGIKGVLRAETCPQGLENPRFGSDVWEALFGPERIEGNDQSFAGALNVGDARLLCLPVRSLYGTFAWVTSPMVLQRYLRDLKEAGATPPQNLQVPTVARDKMSTVSDSVLKNENKVYLEDLDFTAIDGAAPWAEVIATAVFEDATWQDNFKKRLGIVSDDSFNFFAEHGTEVRTRIRIDPARHVVEKGALWTEENLPAETILWGVLGVSRSYSKKAERIEDAHLQAVLKPQRLQVGGKATVGRGQVMWRCNHG